MFCLFSLCKPWALRWWKGELTNTGGTVRVVLELVVELFLVVFASSWLPPAFAIVNVLIYAPEDKTWGVLSDASCLLPGELSKVFTLDERLYGWYLNEHFEFFFFICKIYSKVHIRGCRLSLKGQVVNILSSGDPNCLVIMEPCSCAKAALRTTKCTPTCEVFIMFSSRNIILLLITFQSFKNVKSFLSFWTIRKPALGWSLLPAL